MKNQKKQVNLFFFLLLQGIQWICCSDVPNVTHDRTFCDWFALYYTPGHRHTLEYMWRVSLCLQVKEDSNASTMCLLLCRNKLWSYQAPGVHCVISGFVDWCFKPGCIVIRNNIHTDIQHTFFRYTVPLLNINHG